MIRAPREAFTPNLGNIAGKKDRKDKPKENLEELKRRMADLQARIDKLSRD